MARPCKQNGRSQITQDSATDYSLGVKERKPRKMWLDDEGDLRKILDKCWRIKAMDRTEWRKICEATKVL
jgi:hypothetical protein